MIHSTLCASHDKYKILGSNMFLEQTPLNHSNDCWPYSSVCHWSSWMPWLRMKEWTFLAWRSWCIDHYLNRILLLFSMRWPPKAIPLTHASWLSPDKYIYGRTINISFLKKKTIDLWRNHPRYDKNLLQCFLPQS